MYANECKTLIAYSSRKLVCVCVCAERFAFVYFRPVSSDWHSCQICLRCLGVIAPCVRRILRVLLPVPCCGSSPAPSDLLISWANMKRQICVPFVLEVVDHWKGMKWRRYDWNWICCETSTEMNANDVDMLMMMRTAVVWAYLMARDNRRRLPLLIWQLRSCR